MTDRYDSSNNNNNNTNEKAVKELDNVEASSSSSGEVNSKISNDATTNNDAETTSSSPSQIRQQSGSSPIDIRQASSGKFGVLHARRPSPNNGLMTDINGEPVPIDKIIKTANTMSSIMMAHRIALEDDFKLEPGMDISGPLMSLSPIIGSSPSRATPGGMDDNGQSPTGPSLQSRVKDIVHDAYWDLFKKEYASQASTIKEERKYDISKQLICDIKQKILDLLLQQHARLKQDIEDRLDPQILDQLSKADGLNLLDYARYILSVLAKLCAPVRDEKLRELSETTNIVQLYRGIMEILELMRLDFANFTLNRFKPHIKAHSQDYEREKFIEILNQQQAIGIDGLEFTKIWLDRAVKRVDAIHGISDLVNESNIGDIDNFAEIANCSKEEKILRCDIVEKVLNSAYSELLEWSPKVQKLYPETLVFDEATFKQLGEQYKTLLLTSSILLTTFAFLNKFQLQDSNEFKVLIKSHVITLLTATYDKPAINVTSTTSTMPTTSTDVLDNSGGSNNMIKKQQLQMSTENPIDQIKLETVATRLCEDIRRKIQETNKTLIGSFESQSDLFKRQIVDLLDSSNRVRELARRRILEFVETLLVLDVKHQKKEFPSKMPPPVNIPLGLNCLSDEITLTMAQLVKIIRYNRRVFFQHYQSIIVDIVLKYV